MFSYSPAPNLKIFDYQPFKVDLLKTVLKGLSETQKHLPPFLFYDSTGLVLFEQIKEQPEYYLPRAEAEIFSHFGAEIIDATGKELNIIEPGAGRCDKIEQVLTGSGSIKSYAPMEIQSNVFTDSLVELAKKHPEIQINGLCVNYLDEFQFPDEMLKFSDNRMVYFPGSSIGNYEPAFAKWILRKFRTWVGEKGGLLICFDTPKDETLLNRAYNDSQGITEAFNFNILDHVNYSLRINIPKENFEHQAIYNTTLRRIEMRLVVKKSFTMEIDKNPIFFTKGEYIHTENSYKYEIDEFQRMGKQSGFKTFKHWTDSQQLYAVMYMGH